uniref:Pilus assembly FimT family protein n=1 Tax=Desertifilum tharense IPPAS B-1220 TaxID=1781255 RepID=A0ACD5GYM2_9CYAN
MKNYCKLTSNLRKNSVAGFTMVELLTAIATIGVLSAIATPSWRTFVENQQLNAAQERAYYGLREAQSQAKLTKSNWQMSIRETTVEGKAIAQWTIHPVYPSNFNLHQLNTWQNFNPEVTIDPDHSTLYRHPSGINQGIWRMQFNHHGNPNGQLGRITLSSRRSKASRHRCIFTSTLIGTLRTERDRACRKT